MYLIRDIHNIDFFNKKFSSKSLIATIGNFDGLHLGHKEIIKKMKKIGAKDNLYSLVIFTEPHAKEFFAEQMDSKEQPSRISPWRDKCERLEENKVDFGFYLRFNKKLQNMSPEEFIDKILSKLNIKYLMVGDDFKFGKERSGDFDFLSDWGSNNQIEVDRIPTHNFEGRRVSSTWIRESIAEGNFDLAAKLLDRRYTFSGKVVFGNKVGRTIGVPTANIWVPKRNLPIKGVYAIKALVKGETFNGIANMGIRPTVGGTSPVLEIHIFDFNEKIYGCRIEVEFYQKIRDEKKFENLDKLKEQINLDIAETRKYFS